MDEGLCLGDSIRHSAVFCGRFSIRLCPASWSDDLYDSSYLILYLPRYDDTIHDIVVCLHDCRHYPRSHSSNIYRRPDCAAQHSDDYGCYYVADRDRLHNLHNGAHHHHYRNVSINHGK